MLSLPFPWPSERAFEQKHKKIPRAPICHPLWVMIEGKVEGENVCIGRTYRDAPEIDGYIFINTEETLMTGDFVKVKVTGAHEYDLTGEVIV